MIFRAKKAHRDEVLALCALGSDLLQRYQTAEKEIARWRDLAIDLGASGHTRVDARTEHINALFGEYGRTLNASRERWNDAA